MNNNIPVVLQVQAEDADNIEAAIATHPVLIINSENNEQLMQVVKKHLSGGKYHTRI